MILLPPKLQAFLEIVECGTLVAAAKNLGLTQTGLTQRIKALESDLQSTLFTRSRKGMSLTPEGRAVLKYCSQALELEGLTLSKIQGAKESAEIILTLSGPTSVMSSRISKQLSKVYKKFPGLYLHLNIDDSENRIELLKKGQSQIVILRPEDVVNEVDSKVIKAEEYILVGHPSWCNIDLTDIISKKRIIDFHRDDPTTLNYLRKFKLSKLNRKQRLFVNENHTLISCFCNGVGFGTLTKEIAKPYIQRRELIELNKGQTLKSKLALAWYPRAEMPTYFKEIIQAIQ